MSAAAQTSVPDREALVTALAEEAARTGRVMCWQWVNGGISFAFWPKQYVPAAWTPVRVNVKGVRDGHVH